jgi:SAM-dependent methyltransferase
MRDETSNAAGPGLSDAPLTLRLGIPGATSISIQRRVQDSRFATRYFVGAGIDVGGGPDSLALFGEMFPLIRRVFIYDQQQGDAQFLANVADNAFDFLYSSHCLEHVRDPEEALGNWIRVVRPGGHLVISVPDEDLYEQGQWPRRSTRTTRRPSRYASEHRGRRCRSIFFSCWRGSPAWRSRSASRRSITPIATGRRAMTRREPR